MGSPPDVGACSEVRRRGGRTSSQALAPSGGECQSDVSTRRQIGVPEVRCRDVRAGRLPTDCAADGPRRLPVAADRRRPGAARPGRRGDRRRDPLRAQTAAAPSAPRRSTSPPRSPRSTLRRRAVAKFGDLAAAHVLHPRRARAGHPAGRSPRTGPPGCAPPPPSTAGRPRLRHRRRPARLRPRPASPAPASTSTRCGSRSREANLAALGLERRRDGRRRHHGRHLAVRRRLRRPGPPDRPRAAPSTSTTGPRRGRSSRACCAATPASRSRPGIPHDLVPDGVEAEWVSDHGEVKEAALWSGRLATTAPPRHGDRRRRPGHAHRRGRPGRRRRSRVGAFLYEPDGAVIRAGLVTAVAAGVDGGLLDEHIAYVTVGRVVPDAVRARLPRCSRSCPTGRSRCGPRCASAASAADHQEARRRRRPRRSCASGSPCTATPRPRSC